MTIPRRNAIALRLVWLTSWLVAVPAAELSAQQVLTMDAAVREALQHNHSLAAARAAVGETRSARDEAASGWFPRVTVSEGWQRGDQPVFAFSALLSARRFQAANFAIDALNRPGATGFFHGTATVQQVIFDGGRTRAAVQTATAMQGAATASLDEAAASTVLRVAETYGRLLVVESGATAAESAAAAARESLAHAQRRRDAGTVSEADVLALAVHAADMAQRQIQLGGDAAVLRGELNRLLGAPIDRSFPVQLPLVPEPPAAGSLLALSAEAERSRPELRRADAAVAVAESGVRMARASFWPQVNAQASYQLDGVSMTDRSGSWVVGGEARWNWSVGGAELAGTSRAGAALDRARAERDAARAGVQLDVLTAVRRLESAAARRRVSQASVEQARESQRIIGDRYEAGLAPVQDVLRAAATVLDAERQQIETAVEQVSADRALAHALGRHP